MSTNKSRHPTLRERWCSHFRTSIEAMLRAAEDDVWQPHWSRNDPLPARLARSGCDNTVIEWVIWWLDFIEKLEGGEPPDRSTEPFTPECICRAEDEWNRTDLLERRD